MARGMTSSVREGPANPEGLRDVAGRERRGWLRSAWFSVLAGIVAPIACFALQPALLHGMQSMLPGLRFIDTFWLFSYGVMGQEMLALALWLAFRDRPGAWSAWLSGVLLAGALFAGGLGLVLLPISLIGLLAVIGILGFVPFLTSAVFFAHAAEAYRRARRVAGNAIGLGLLVLGGLMVVGGPAAVEVTVWIAAGSAIRGIAAGDPSATARLRPWARLVSLDHLTWAYAAEPDPVRKTRLADAFRELTGEDVEARIKRLDD